MDFIKIFNSLKSILIPKVYINAELCDSNFYFGIFKSRDFMISRYLLALSKVSKETDLINHIENIRNEIGSKYKAKYIIREIGLHIMLLSENGSLTEEVTKLKADTFGDHSVILQGLHLLDIETKTISDTQSHWGPLNFGKGKKIDLALKEVVNTN